MNHCWKVWAEPWTIKYRHPLRVFHFRFMLTSHCILDSGLSVSTGIKMYNPLDKQPFKALLIVTIWCKPYAHASCVFLLYKNFCNLVHKWYCNLVITLNYLYKLWLTWWSRVTVIILLVMQCIRTQRENAIQSNQEWILKEKERVSSLLVSQTSLSYGGYQQVTW